jgi:hypothetical protein
MYVFYIQFVYQMWSHEPHKIRTQIHEKNQNHKQSERESESFIRETDKLQYILHNVYIYIYIYIYIICI